MLGGKPTMVALREVCWDGCHLQLEILRISRARNGQRSSTGRWPCSWSPFYAFITCKQEGMSECEACQYGRCPRICIGHVVPRRPNAREVGEILLGIAVMTQPPH